MNYITQIMNWISTGLMLPVIVLLILILIASMISLGGLVTIAMSMFSERKRSKDIIADFCKQGKLPKDTKRSVFAAYLNLLAKNNFDELVCEKIISDLKARYDRDLEKAKFLTKVGPMLGLMGTLIPMGPALANLASGDISSMANNMQIAFATTVVGCFVAGIGLLIYSLKKHYYHDEISNLVYLLEWKLNSK